MNHTTETSMAWPDSIEPAVGDLRLPDLPSDPFESIEPFETARTIITIRAPSHHCDDPLRGSKLNGVPRVADPRRLLQLSRLG